MASDGWKAEVEGGVTICGDDQFMSLSSYWMVSVEPTNACHATWTWPEAATAMVGSTESTPAVDKERISATVSPSNRRYATSR